MGDDRAARRRARREGGVQATHEMLTVALQKVAVEELRKEQARVPAARHMSQAEFAGHVLESALNGMRIQRELREAEEARKNNLVQEATPEQAATILTRPYVGRR